jgi:DNA-binding GntR family transcriptional regulator
VDSEWPSLPAPDHAVLSDKVYEVLREALLSHRIEPGARMNLAGLARSLHVSNTPLRQALARLQSEGLVIQEAYRGYTATPLLEERTIAHLYETRLVVEPAGSEWAAQRVTQAELEQLQSLCEPSEIEGLLGRDDSVSALGQRDIDLHTLIAELSGNPVLAGVVSDLAQRATRYTLYHQRSAATEAWDEHRDIVRAIESKDPEAARQAMTSHLHKGLERMRQAVR